jgi:hypothetical protein
MLRPTLLVLAGLVLLTLVELILRMRRKAA